MKHRSLLAVLAFVSASVSESASSQINPVEIRVIVKQKDVGAEMPFPRVGHFMILRNSTPYAEAECPDASDKNGELICTVSCVSRKKNATLLLMPPKRDLAVVVAGMAVPPARELKVSDCKLTTPQPVVLVYRTVAAQLAEFRERYPEVYSAAVTGSGKDVKLKPFASAQKDLEVLARDQSKRVAIRELGELARLEGERKEAFRKYAEVSRPTQTSHRALEMDNYVVGTRSVLLKAQVVDAMGSTEADNLVRVSSEPVELDKSISRVTRSLGDKNVLDNNERMLERATRTMATEGTILTTPAAGTMGTMGANN